MNRFRSLDVTLETLSAQLYPDERILAHADGVGLYDGKDKSPQHDDGRAVLSSHRVLFISSSRPHSNSVALDLSLVRQTEYWAGFVFKSSPKITLLLGDAGRGDEARSSPVGEISGSTAASGSGGSAMTKGDKESDRLALVASAGDRSWVCRVCGMRNVPTVESGLKCTLCGVAMDQQASSSTPVTRLGTPRSASPKRPSTAAPTAAPPPFDPAETGSRIACPVCTFLNHHSMATCEMCDSPLFGPASTNRPPPPRPASATAAPSTSPAPPVPSAAFVRLSFRRGGEKVFYAALKTALASKAWDLKSLATPSRKSLDAARSGTPGAAQSGEQNGSSSGAGIDAIMRGIDLDARDREDSLDEALRDLDSLMARAKNMIALAQSINAQLAVTSATDPSAVSAETAEAASLATSSLQSLGLLSAPVTAQDVADSSRYHAQLAQELASVLQKGQVMEKQGGVIGLDEVWCLWNRARGVALTASLEEQQQEEIEGPAPGGEPAQPPKPGARERRGGQAPQEEEEDEGGLRRGSRVRKQATHHLFGHNIPAGADEPSLTLDRQTREGLGVLEVADAEKLSVGLAKEMMELLEMGEATALGGRVGGGAVVRDEQGGEGTRWQRNYISHAVWDGQVV
ncbi:Vacuolar protein sorting-associated protein 36 [Rhodotorula toruloides ATCC 204091]|uniref:Vacuolar protein-sorting-associated protein 36 n=1 Tax=Rhodotorula toruloides TaxID=5286 RepID=A0A0K3CTE3_RHOTO|nr:Vacuolar protein sorting-associated protein 36 [Rhodotorula toruloides ATCC 204091]